MMHSRIEGNTGVVKVLTAIGTVLLTTDIMGCKTLTTDDVGVANHGSVVSVGCVADMGEATMGTGNVYRDNRLSKEPTETDDLSPFSVTVLSTKIIANSNCSWTSSLRSISLCSSSSGVASSMSLSNFLTISFFSNKAS